MVTQNPFTGRSSGKLANVVASTWKGKNVLKSKPLSVANPRTEAQISQRNFFSIFSSYAKSLKILLLITFRLAAQGMTERNFFMKINNEAAKLSFLTDDFISPITLAFVSGSKETLQLSLNAQPTGNVAHMTFQVSNEYGWTATDCTMLLYCQTLDSENIIATTSKDLTTLSSTDESLTFTNDIDSDSNYIFGIVYNKKTKEYTNCVVITNN